jgi:hypothetical protein
MHGAKQHFLFSRREMGDDGQLPIKSEKLDFFYLTPHDTEFQLPPFNSPFYTYARITIVFIMMPTSTA